MDAAVPYFFSDNEILNRAARIAAGDIGGNCVPFRDGLLREERLCIMAGLDYDTPWTRDTAINTMNALCISHKAVAYNTLLSVCTEKDGRTYIGGQYWDAIIWAIGAWQYYLVTSDAGFLTFAANTVIHSLEEFEETEFDPVTGLFKGAAVYGDGVAAYPDPYAKVSRTRSGILHWAEDHASDYTGKGYPITMKALSTNCVYYAAYRIAAAMQQLLGKPADGLTQKADGLKAAINRHFWNEETGRYDYIFDEALRCSHAEALGLSYAILFGIADRGRTESIIRNTYVTDHGIACLWPSFDRYRIGDHYGRHSGTVWPHAQGFWALAMRKAGNTQGFEKELFGLASKASRDMHFAEIYHPVTGQIYGGLQEDLDQGIVQWKSCERQTWSATAFLSMQYYGVFGLEFSLESVTVKPQLPTGVNHAELKNLQIGDALVTILVDRSYGEPCQITIPKNLQGVHIFKAGQQ